MNFDYISDGKFFFYKAYSYQQSTIGIKNSKIKYIYITVADSLESPDFIYENDTIGSFTIIDKKRRPDPANDPTHAADFWPRHSYTFKKCHIENLVTAGDRYPDSRIIFENCTFGPQVNFLYLHVARIEFKDCLKFERKLHVGFATDSASGEIRIINSDIDNLEPSWTKNMKLFFDISDDADTRGSTYESLLAKYKSNGRIESYKAVDLQYRRDDQNVIFYYLNAIWWYHGYEKGLVFIWIIFFMLLFAFFNYRLWDNVHSTYPIISKEYSYFSETNAKMAKLKRVVLYTIFIFFSLKIDFDKLEIKSNWQYLVYFFVQYTIGLFCILFVVKAILQI